VGWPGRNGHFYSLYPDIVANGSQGQYTAEGLFYRRNYPVPPQRHSIRHQRKRIAPITNGLPSENKM